MSGFANDANKAIKALDDLDQKADGASTAVVKWSDGTDKAAGSTRNLNQSNQSLTKSTEAVGKTTKSTSNVVLSFSDNITDVTDKTQDWEKTINGAVKALAGLFTTIFVSSGLAKLVSEISSSNDQLHFLSKNLGMNADTIKKWQNVAEMSGGSADGMAATMSSLNKSLWDLVTVGDASILPFFNALGVGVVDSYGKIRKLDDILLDMADSMSQMERPQAYNIGKSMGLDDGTINTLLEGREAIQKRLDAQKNIVISTKEELELNRQLREQNSVLSQQWEGLKTIIANYLTPRLLKLSTMVSGFLDYLNKHRDTTITLFQGIATVIGLSLIPVVGRAALAMLGLFAPLITGTGLILAFVAALWLLHDDYKGWKEGKDSFFDWGTMHKSFVWIMEQLEKLEKWFKGTTIGKWFTDTNGELDNFKLALGGFALFFGGPWLASILTTLSLAGLGLIRFFGLPGLLVGGALAAFFYFKNKIDDFDWDKLGDNLGKMAVEGIKRTQAAKNVIEAENPKDKTRAALAGFGDLIPGGGMAQLAVATDIPGKISETISKNTDKQGNISWSGVAKDVLSSASKTFDAALIKSKERSASKTHVHSKNANDLKGQAALNAMRGYFIELEKKYKLPAGILYGVAMTESSGNRFEVSNKGAKGPFQFMPPTAAEYGLKGNDVFDWYKSGDAAARYLSWLLKQTGSTDGMLAAYNGGIGNLKEKGIANMPAQTREYVPKVKKYREKELQDRKAQGIAQSISDFQARMNQPLIPNMDMNAPHEFLAQTDRIRNMPMAGATNNVKVDLNGDINVTTTANTVTGTVTDAGEAARLSLSQIMTSMS
nr:transglycosylase SLT domain-containing protein [Xenorhabdus indica]